MARHLLVGFLPSIVGEMRCLVVTANGRDLQLMAGLAHSMRHFPLLMLVGCLSSGAANWPQFRGEGGLATADSSAPIHFGPESNVLWKVELPTGNSSPVIWGEKLFLTANSGSALETLCLNRKTGAVLWSARAPVVPIEKTHRIGSPASSTPVTDGKRVYVYFGSFGLLAYDFSGKELWRKPLPAPVVEFGSGASPILAGGNLIQVCDQDSGSFLLAVNPATGESVWRVDRPAFRRSFATPFLWKHEGIEELIVPGSIWLKSYDPKSGSENWTFSGTSRVATASPTSGDGLLFSSSWNIGGDEDSRVAMEPFAEFAAVHDKNKDGKLTPDEIPSGPVRDRFSQMDLDKDRIVTAEEWEEMRQMFARAGNAVLAIRPGGKGDITKSHLAWRVTRSLPYVASPVFSNGRLFTMKNGGLLSCYEAASGKPIIQDERVGIAGDYYSSGIAAGDHVYFISQSGTVIVVASKGSPSVVATNPLGEQVMATPAIVDGVIYLRSAKHLWAFGVAK